MIATAKSEFWDDPPTAAYTTVPIRSLRRHADHRVPGFWHSDCHSLFSECQTWCCPGAIAVGKWCFGI